ncbi:hypothetical protein CDO73_07020 [Saccharibacillus sp. O23]|uniref:class I SAM-dependent methyltransferase n=1 Tax=Saccharibacillus sp. O23 TaxID=2009338 RepID=UPI000B4E6F9C|nr:class I SAM-dependent methyltransferase [Saccharibacillus sp. O23]OWR31472.1 hypothetical protein CDO73_07020 [Saccharibacillus sp. O23]
MQNQSKYKAESDKFEGQGILRSAARGSAGAIVGSDAGSNPDSRWESSQAAAYSSSIPAKIPGYANLYEMGARLLSAALNARAEAVEEDTDEEAEDRNPRILIVGAGGGQELETFGRAEPDWRFVGIDPSAVMLEQARLRIRGTGIESRTVLVQSELDPPDRQPLPTSSSSAEGHAAAHGSVRLACAKSGTGAAAQPASSDSAERETGSAPFLSPASAETETRESFGTTAYDGAACMLVLHFVRGTDAKKKMLRAIAERLKPGAPLLIASLNADLASPAYSTMMEAWRLHMRAGGVPEEDWRRFAASLGPQSDPIPAAEVESLLEECGFVRPQRYFGAFLIDGWLTFRNGGDGK